MDLNIGGFSVRHISFRIALALALVCAPAARPAHAAAPVRADSLGIKDLLDLGNANIQDLTADGRWLAVTLGNRRDALGIDYFHDNDPTYVHGPLTRLVVIDTKTGARRDVFTTKKTMRGAAWSPDGTKLALFVLEGDAYQLTVWDRATGKLTIAKTPAAQYVAENSELRWSEDGRHIVFALRSMEWKKKATDRFSTLTKGPIVVLDGSDPFLEWEDLGRMAAVRSIASFDLTTGAVKTLIPEGRINTWTLAKDGSAITTNEDLAQRTNYGGGGGRANKMIAHFTSGAPNKTIFATTQGVQVSWANDGKHYAVTRDGRVFIASIDDTMSHQILGDTGRIANGGAGGRGGRGGGGRGGRGGGVVSDTTPADTSAAARAAANNRFAVSRWSEQGDEILATNRQGIWVVNVATGAKEMLVAVPDSASLQPRPTVTLWSHDGRYIYLNVASRTQWDRSVVRFDRQTKQQTTLTEGAKYFGGLRVSDDGATAVLTVADGNHVADIYTADAALGGMRRLVESNPQLATKPIAKTELISYHDADGKSEYGVLFYPANYEKGKRYPTVFIIYEDFFDDTWDPVANLLSAHGYAVVKPSVQFEIGYPGEAWVKGVTAAANKVIEMGVADSSRLGVHGTSYGGYATNLLVTQTDRFKAAINMSGKVDIISFYTDSPRLGARNINAAEASQDRIGATLWEQPQKYVQHSAVMFADRIKTPMLLMTGGQDHNVPEINEREMYYALRRLGKTVTWVSYTNSGHGTPGTNESDFTDYYQRVLDWYAKYLQPNGKKAAND